ncbi:MAG: nuclear transport factor 2 family protein [Acidobacteria bacterium]|nr:nuclear transport factor 2 family protein [Acidobacteriota bacterium]
MSEAHNIKLVQDSFAAFSKGDIAALLELLSDDVVWHGVYGGSADVPQAGERRGRAAVAEFFKLVAQNTDFSRFEPQQFVATGDTVVTLGHYEGRVKTTGRSFDSDFAMVSAIKNGRIARFQEFTNSAAVNAAFAPVGAGV